MAVCSGDNDVTLESSVGNLTADVGVGRSDDHSVLRSVIFILILNDETFPSIVIGLSLSPPAELHLIPLEIGFVLDDFDKRHINLYAFFPSEKQSY